MHRFIIYSLLLLVDHHLSSEIAHIRVHTRNKCVCVHRLNSSSASLWFSSQPHELISSITRNNNGELLKEAHFCKINNLEDFSISARLTTSMLLDSGTMSSCVSSRLSYVGRSSKRRVFFKLLFLLDTLNSS